MIRGSGTVQKRNAKRSCVTIRLKDSDVDFTAPVAALLEVPEGQMLDLNEDNGDDDDDVSDYYTITTYCQNGLRINGSCQSCGAPERASCVCLFQDLRHYVSNL